MRDHDPDQGASASASEIVDDIEQTREELGATIDAIAAKLDVKSQLKETVGQAKGNVIDSAGQAAGHARQRWPEIAVVLVTTVAALIVWRRMP